MSQPRVDIAIPVYNGADHIAECLESLLRQTHANWVATVVNNCSTDATGGIADAFARRDARIRVSHETEFVDQCGNYNRALSHITGESEYGKIVEADNWLMPDALARMIELGETSPRLGVIGAYWLHGTEVGGAGLEPSCTVLPGLESIRLFFRRRVYLFGAPTTVMFRTRAVRDEATGFRPGLFYDDFDFCIRLLKSWDFGYVHQILAYVREDNGGVFDWIRRADHYPAFRYFLLQDYGRDLFSGPELDQQRTRCRRDYLNRLGEACISRRGTDYWKLHRTLFRQNHESFPTLRLAWPVARAILVRLANPGSTLRNVMHRR